MDVLTAAPIAAGRTSASRADARGLARQAWKPFALASFAVWVLFIGAHHEPWFDEAQAWLLARDSGLGELLFERVRYEGTPGLWPALLWFCIRAGLPYAHLYIVSCTCAVLGAAIILWRSPFPPVLRCLLIASYFPAYQYAVVARSYALDLVLVPALAALFSQRAARPWLYGALIGLLANCNAHSFLAAALLGCEFAITLVRRKPRNLRPLSLPVALGLFAAFSAWPPADGAFLTLGVRPPPGEAVIIYIRQAFFDRLTPWAKTFPSVGSTETAFVISLAFLASTLILLRCAGAIWLTVALVGTLVGFSVFFYGSVWHAGLLFLFWIFALWIGWDASARGSVARYALIMTLALPLGAQTAETVLEGVWDAGNTYSAGQATSQTLMRWRAEHPTGTIAAAGAKVFAVQPYFTGNIFANYHGGSPTPAYATWMPAQIWRFDPSNADLDALTSSGADVLLVSARKLAAADITARMAAAGYREAIIFPGALEWKGVELENDSILLFARHPDPAFEP